MSVKQSLNERMEGPCCSSDEQCTRIARLKEQRPTWLWLIHLHSHSRVGYFALHERQVEHFTIQHTITPDLYSGAVPCNYLTRLLGIVRPNLLLTQNKVVSHMHNRTLGRGFIRKRASDRARTASLCIDGTEFG